MRRKNDVAWEEGRDRAEERLAEEATKDKTPVPDRKGGFSLWVTPSFPNRSDSIPGGQTPLSRAVRKKGFHNPNHVEWTALNLDRLSEGIEKGKVPTDEIITMKTLRDCDVVGKKIRHGVKILSRGSKTFRHRVHLQVSKCSIAAEKAIERNGGSVRLVYYDKTGLRALLKPQSYIKKGWMIPEPARFIPSRLARAYDFPGDTSPDTKIDTDSKRFETPERKKEDAPKLPQGKGHIKTRCNSKTVVDYGRKARKRMESADL